ncbi:hypothetical protein SAMN05428970_1638 [Agromyces sp. CF514]|uniref:DUF6264 family protein n=1 Tax=Agromyces sp. CF514 TaxID=1881031 RepID=UPI0008EE1B2B|nr:DUF6264 family protein [Agromyces sp. CF514]SFR73984.1 hypothetical protein SAMN05428970_1638 [Agromyces sp. CF514]
MTHDEAARTTGAAGQDSPRPTPPIDERPRPRYGEYAPEGWTWQPPVDPNAVPDAAAAVAANDPSAAATAAPGAHGAAGSAPVPATAPAVPKDRLWTIALLVFGVFGAIYNIMAIVQLPATALESAKLSSAMLGVDGPTSFTPGPAVPTILATGVVLQIALWIGALLWSRARLRAGRLSWWIPLVAGVVAFVVVTVIGILVFASDPEFLTSLSTANV